MSSPHHLSLSGGGGAGGFLGDDGRPLSSPLPPARRNYATAEYQAVILATSMGSALFPLTREEGEAAAIASAGGQEVPAGAAASTAAGVGASSEAIGRSQLLVANRPLLCYQLDMIHKAGFQQVIVVTRDSMRRGVTRIIDEWRVARGGQAMSADLGLPPSVPPHLGHSPSLSSMAGGAAPLLDVDLVCLETYRGTADALRQISEKIHTDFFCLSGDLISNVQFQNLADLHRAQDAGVVLCVQNSQDAAGSSAAVPGTAADKERRKEADEAAAVDAQYLGIDASTGRLLIFQSAADVEDRLAIDKRLLQRHPHLTLHTHLRDCHLYVFSQWVLLFLHSKPSIVSIRSELLPCLVQGQYKEKYAEWRHYGKNSRQVAALRMSHAPRKGNESVIYGSAASLPQGAPLGQPQMNRGFSSMDAPSDHALRQSASMTSIAGSNTAAGASRFVAPLPQESFRLFVYQASALTFCQRAHTLSAYKQLNHELAQEREYAYQPWPIVSTDNHAASVSKSHPPQSVAVNNYSVLGDSVKFKGEQTTVKRSCVARHCNIGAKVKLQGCVIMEGCTIEDGCNLTDCLVGAYAVIGKGSVLKDCKIGAHFRVDAGTEAKNEILAEDD